MAKPQRILWIWVLLALVAGLCLRLYFVLAAPRIAGDTLVYGDFAKNLIEHHVYGFSVANGPPRPSLIRVPGYPLFLAACFLVFGVEHYQPILYLQTVIDLGTCLLIAALARRLFGSRAGMAALWLAALCPFTANYVATPLTETLSLFVITAAFYSLERWRTSALKPAAFNAWILAIAASLSAAILLRPEQGLLSAAVLPAIIWIAWRSAPRAHRLRALVPAAIAFLLIVLPFIPWTMRNHRTFHVFQPLAPRFANDPGEFVPLGFQHWYRTWAIDFASTESVYWNYDGNDINPADLPNRAFDSQSQYTRAAALLTQYNLTDRATPDLDRGFDALAQERIADNPIRYYLALPSARLANMLLRPRLEMMAIPLEWWHLTKHPGQTAFAAFYAALNLCYFIFGSAGLYATYRRAGLTPKTSPHPASSATLLAATAAYVILRCALLLTIDNSEPRYTLEFFPILCLWAAALFCRKTHNTIRPE